MPNNLKQLDKRQKKRKRLGLRLNRRKLDLRLRWKLPRKLKKLE